jgi:hypothetical protein
MVPPRITLACGTSVARARRSDVISSPPVALIRRQVDSQAKTANSETRKRLAALHRAPMIRGEASVSCHRSDRQGRWIFDLRLGAVAAWT